MSVRDILLLLRQCKQHLPVFVATADGQEHQISSIHFRTSPDRLVLSPVELGKFVPTGLRGDS